MSKFIHDTDKAHDDMIVETLSTLLGLCNRNPPVTGGFPSQKVSHSQIWSTLSC